MNEVNIVHESALSGYDIQIIPRTSVCELIISNESTPVSGGGDSFNPTLNYTITGNWTFTKELILSSGLDVTGTINTNNDGSSTEWANAYTHSQIANGNPHGVTYSNIGGTPPDGGYWTKVGNDISYGDGNVIIDGSILKVKDSTKTKNWDFSVDSNGHLILTGALDKNLHVSGDVVAFSASSPPAASWWDDMPIATIASLGGIIVGDNLTIDGNGKLDAIASSSLELGITSATAHRGDHGNAAYLHSELITGNPHSVTKANVGLSSVPNTDFTSAVASNTAHKNTITGNPHAINLSDIGESYSDINYWIKTGNDIEYTVGDVKIFNDLYINGTVYAYSQDEINVGDSWFNLGMADAIGQDGGLRMYSGTGTVELSKWFYDVSLNQWSTPDGGYFGGNINIGSATSLSAKLNVNGIAESSTFGVKHDPSFTNIITIQDQDGDNAMQISGIGANGTLKVELGDVDGSGNGTYLGIDDSSGKFTFYDGDVVAVKYRISSQWSIGYSGANLYFYNASGVKKMKLDQSGNLSTVGEITAFATI